MRELHDYIFIVFYDFDLLIIKILIDNIYYLYKITIRNFNDLLYSRSK